MGELKSCGSLVNANAVCVIENETKTDNAKIAEISEELHRERAKNAQLMQRISMLEAQIQQRGNCRGETERSIKKLKRQKLGHIREGKASQMKCDLQSVPLKDSNSECLLVNWMSLDDYQFSHINQTNEDNFGADCEKESDDSDDEDYANADQVKANSRQDVINMKLSDAERVLDQNETKEIGDFKKEACDARLGNVSYDRKPPKVAFCPKEVKRILESEVLLAKNALSHTIRKIIVFASLGIRHGCDDMHELDFNHFSILKKGQPYVSPNDPGEHVLYENPGIRRKIFFPNPKNPVLCPVQILEDEKAMRPSDSSCPSCLFLCIKYGGRTRNLPQNEYVRQRMGRNKLKSFGPLMCRMAMLVHVRRGSFFFKALGITLLVMAGFPDDLVQRETKHRNVALLQKYYRTDKDAADEQLFLSHQETHENVSPTSEKPNGKKSPTISKGKKQANSLKMKSSSLQSAASSPALPRQLAFMPLTSLHNQVIPLPSQPQLNTQPVRKQPVNNSDIGLSYHNRTPYPTYPPQIPLTYWSLPSTFPPVPCSYHIPSFPSPPYYLSINPLRYHNHSPPSCSSSVPKVSGKQRSEIALKEAESTSHGSRAETEEA